MREPSGKPVLTGPSRSNRDDAEWALTCARRYRFRGGNWTPQVQEFVDTWLDFLNGIPPGERYPPACGSGIDGGTALGGDS